MSLTFGPSKKMRLTTKFLRANPFAGRNRPLAQKARAVFAQLRNTSPKGLAYALFQDGNDFVHVFLNLQADASAPLTELPTFKTFENGIVERCEVPPNVTRLAAQLV